MLLGIEHDNSFKKSGLSEKKNVKYFGKKAYDQLAGYVDYLDVCIIPFLVNDVTKATSPVKLFEYMAMEKQVVTTALPECLKYEAVNIANTPEEFEEALIECYRNKENKEVKDRLRECAWENDWSAKADELKRCLRLEVKNEG